MPRLTTKNVRYHFEGIRGKVMQVRELVEGIDQMFDSFHRVNQISKTILSTKFPKRDRDWFESRL